MFSMKHALMIALIVAVSGCKQRHPDDAGLLDADPNDETPTLVVPSGPRQQGLWTINCAPEPLDSDVERSSVRYRFDVQGATDPTDEAQELVVSAYRLDGGSSVLALSEIGRGTVSVEGPIFVGFASGVLTAEKIADGSFAGVTTLSKDAQASALAVGCRVVKGSDSRG